jgi:hypothetical protein
MSARIKKNREFAEEEQMHSVESPGCKEKGAWDALCTA